jgi:hypothetical protein
MLKSREHIWTVAILVALLFCGALPSAGAGQETEPASAGPEGDPLAPLPENMVLALKALESDPPPPKLIRDVHYVISNERHFARFQAPAADRGGISIGVGAEQNYVLAGWSRPEIIILMDFDQWIVDLHVVHGVAFSHADTIEEYVDLWSPERSAQLKTWLDEKIVEQDHRRRFARMMKYAVPRVYKHLVRLRKRQQKAGEKTYLTEPEQYTFVASLWRTGRAHAVRGDLTASATMRSISSFATKFGLSIRLLYLSNAEYYFTYDDGSFRENVAGLPMDDKSVVLHTHPRKNNNYDYYYHSGPNFQAWVGEFKARWFRSLLKHAEPSETKGLHIIRKTPAELPQPQPKKKKKKKKPAA